MNTNICCSIIIAILICSLFFSCLSFIGMLTAKPFITPTEEFNQNNQVQGKKKNEIVLFCTSWCGYSNQMLPEWTKFQNYAKAVFPDLIITLYKCEGEGQQVCNEMGITGYPTIILFRKDGKKVTFNQERTSAKLVEFVKNNIK